MNVNHEEISIDTQPIFDILIVDDTPDNLRLLSAVLKAENYSVRKATNGEMALRAIDFASPDLILLDVQMPGMNGYELCSQLKKNVETKNIPIIFISAKDDIFDKGTAFDVGGVDYIVKPFYELEVVMRVKHQITIARQLKELTRQQKKLMVQNKQLQIEIEKRKQLEKKLASLLKNRHS
jgi:two-component system sensor histidine kinase/response regulator